MNKKRIDKYIPKAYAALKDNGIAEAKNGKLAIQDTFRGYIASFGAAVTMGSLLSAVAFFTKHSDKTLGNRTLLMKAIYNVITGKVGESGNCLLEYVIEKKDENGLKEDILDAAIAIKLAMNMYNLEPEVSNADQK